MDALRPIDTDQDLVPLLRTAPNELLGPLVAYLTQHGAGRITSQLDRSPGYLAHFPDHQLYADEIAAELQRYGGNTLANLARGGRGVPYWEIAVDVAKRLNAEVRSGMSVAQVEGAILLRVLEQAYSRMSGEERRLLFETLGIEHAAGVPSSLPLVVVQAAISASGIAGYQVAVVVANAVARLLLGRGLSLGANAALTRALGVFAGPIGWTVTGLWTVAELAGPAYRVTIPAVIQVAAIRLSAATDAPAPDAA